MLVNLAVALRYGWWGILTAESEPAIGCNTEAWLLWLGAGGLFACAFLRVYRSHSVVIRQNAVMWPVLLQLALTLVPFVFPPAFFSLRTSLITFDEETQECERQSDGPEAFALGVMVFLAVLTTALTSRLQKVRFQVLRSYNEVSCAMSFDGSLEYKCRVPTTRPVLLERLGLCPVGMEEKSSAMYGGCRAGPTSPD